MGRIEAVQMIERYLASFNRGDVAGMEALVSQDVEHRTNQGSIRHGRAAFAEFNASMSRHYREELEDIVVMANESGTRVAAEFIVNGTYLSADDGLPPASGQTYVLPAAILFEIENGRITRLSTYYNLADWIAQVGGQIG